MTQYLPLHEEAEKDPAHHFTEQSDYKVTCDNTNDAAALEANVLNVDIEIAVYQQAHVTSTEEDIPVSDNPSGMYCKTCRSQGVSHCADPEHCGGMQPMRVPETIKSRFICLEGIDFSGKTTVIKILSKYFEDQGIPYITTREPGGCEMAEKLRSIVLENSTRLAPMSELLLFMAARNEHIYSVILPALQEGKVVLCDRFLGSSYIYQGLIKEIPLYRITDVFNSVLYSDPRYATYLDHHIQTFVLDISYEVALERALARGGEPDRLDIVDYSDFTSSRDGYKDLPNFNNLFKHNFHIIDAEPLPVIVASMIINLAKGEKHEVHAG